ncbi:hypothetical protein JOB18_005201 [Solea senegalensis]|uniref:Uncharacterized protein n=1 Tax=Solea senegalensis TaxID=28829 RepID=A0AAV6PVP5_SOLSE|nr:hypothetical protein JOB18_005201 [Solea senegalensis]
MPAMRYADIYIMTVGCQKQRIKLNSPKGTCQKIKYVFFTVVALKKVMTTPESKETKNLDLKRIIDLNLTVLKSNAVVQFLVALDKSIYCNKLHLVGSLGPGLAFQSNRTSEMEAGVRTEDNTDNAVGVFGQLVQVSADVTVCVVRKFLKIQDDSRFMKQIVSVSGEEKDVVECSD